MRDALLALVLLSAGLAGCLQDGEPIDGLEPTSADPGEANRTQPDQGDGEGSSPTNATSSPRPNETVPGPEENTSQDASDPAPPLPALPGNVSLEDARVLERNRTHVHFRWEASVPATGDPGVGPSEVTTFLDVPPGLPVEINASVAWSQARDVEIVVRDWHVLSFCSSPPEDAEEGSSSTEACEVRTFPRSSWDRWNVTVQAFGRDEADPQAATPVQVDVTVETVRRWDGPPFDGGEADASAPPEDGWPALEEATIRPGVRIGGVAGTAGFVFTSPDNRTLYLAYIAHGVAHMRPGDAIEVGPGATEGTLVYCSWGVIEQVVDCPRLEFGGHPTALTDLALIRLPASARGSVHPAVPLWGGPTGIAQPPGQGAEVLAFGNTTLRDGGLDPVDALDPKRGIVRAADAQRTWTTLVPSGIPGDSGGPVLTVDGQALGLLSSLRYGAHISQGTQEIPGENGVSNTAHHLRMLEQRTPLALELATWPMFDPPRGQDLAPASGGSSEGPMGSGS